MLEKENKAEADNIDVSNVHNYILNFIFIIQLIEADEREKLSQYTSKKISIQDFTTLRLIGKGSYGKVLLVEKKDDKKVYAMKILKKKAMQKRNQVNHIKTERKIMELIDHPFIIKLRYAFQTPQKLYFVMDYCPGGELFFHIQKVERFNEDAVKFYGAQIALALDHLHKNNIIYRE